MLKKYLFCCAKYFLLYLQSTNCLTVRRKEGRGVVSRRSCSPSMTSVAQELQNTAKINFTANFLILQKKLQQIFYSKKFSKKFFYSKNFTGKFLILQN